MADQHSLVDGAGVVVQAAGDRQVSHELAGSAAHGLGDDLLELGQALVEQLVLDAEGADLLHEGGVLGADARQLQRGVCLLLRGAHVLDEVRRHGLGADLLELVDLAQHGGGVVEADAAVEALGELAVVDPQHELRDGQLREGVDDHQGHLDVVAERQCAVADDVDVRLRELAGAALLGALAAPDLLDLVAAEREVQVPGVVHDVAGERHGEVEVQRQLALLGTAVLVLLQTGDAVDLLVDLALAQQLIHGLHSAGLDRGEPVQLEGLPQRVEHVQLHEPLLREPLGEAGEGGLAGHGASSPEDAEGGGHTIRDRPNHLRRRGMPGQRSTDSWGPSSRLATMGRVQRPRAASAGP